METDSLPAAPFDLASMKGDAITAENIWNCVFRTADSITYREFVTSFQESEEHQNLIYEIDERRYINVSMSTLRGVRRWLFRENKTDMLRKDVWTRVMRNWEPFVFKTNENFQNHLFYLSEALLMLNMPCFTTLDYASVYSSLVRSHAGDHYYRFSSQSVGWFALQIKVSKDGIGSVAKILIKRGWIKNFLFHLYLLFFKKIYIALHLMKDI